MSALRIIKDAGEFEGIKAAWDELAQRKCGGHPFFIHSWFLNYYRAYYNNFPLRIYLWHDADHIDAVLPMLATRRRLGGIPLKELKFLAGDHSHINGPVAASDSSQKMSDILQDIIDEGFDLVYFEDFPERFWGRSEIEEFCGENKCRLEIRNVRNSPYIETTGTFEDYRSNLSKKFNQLLNNRINRINKAGGFQIKSFVSAADYDEVIDAMKAITKASWQGKKGSGVFSGDKNDRFYRAVIGEALAGGYGQVHVLYFDGKPAAFEFHMIHGDTEYCLKSEYIAALSKLSPGGVLDLELVRRAFASKVGKYDLLGYEDDYKLRWTDRATPYYRYFIFGNTAAGRLAHKIYFDWGDLLRSGRRRNN